jgi:DNA-binding NarL/FixJ family response regulator
MISRLALRELAVARDADAHQTVELGPLWTSICRGTWRFLDVFATNERHLALLQEPAGAPSPISARKLQLLESVLLGKPPKVVAMERQRSLSSITGATQDCLRAMGLVGGAAQASVLLTMAVRAAHRPGSSPRIAAASELRIEDERIRIVSVSRPDLRLPETLSLAEATVLRSLLAGETYAQISSARETSQRTVANQLAAAFRKLGVSGRRATIERLIQRSAQLA